MSEAAHQSPVNTTPTLLAQRHWPNAAVVAALFGLFLYLTTITPVIGHSIAELGNLDGIRGLYGVERIKDEQGAEIVYSWTQAEAGINFHNVSRLAPLEFSLVMSLDRPGTAPPGRVELTLQDRQGRPVEQLGRFEFKPEQPGFNRYSVIIPRSSTPGEPDFTVQLASNGFKPGDGRELGVRLSAYELKALTGWRELFGWPYPYAGAVLLFGLGLLLWSVRLKLSWLETALLAAPLLIAAAFSAQYMQTASWWLGGCALVFCAGAALFGQSSLGPLKFPLKTPLEFSGVLLAVLAVIGFLVPSWPALYDTRYYLDWNRDISRYGLVGIYSHSQSLNYPPLIVYILWIYGLVVQPLGLGESLVAIKTLMSLAVVLLVWVVWRHYRAAEKRPAHFWAGLVVLGISAGSVYNPAVYGQSDAPLGLLLVWSFLLINEGKTSRGAIVMGLSLLYKLQTIYLAPLLVVLMLRRSGWRKTVIALLLAGLMIAGLALPIFGFSWAQFSNYWNQGQLAGDGLLEYGGYNILDLLDANSGRVNWIVPVGFGVIGLVYLGLAASIWLGRTGQREAALASALAILVCIIIGIKAKQHYYYYPLPFVGLAAMFDRRLFKPWLLLGAIYTLMLLSTFATSRRGQVYDNFFTWNRLIKEWYPLFPQLLSLAALATFLYLLACYGRDWWHHRLPQTSLKAEELPASKITTSPQN